MLHRLARATLMGVLLIGLALTSTAGVVAKSDGADLSVALTGPARVKSGAAVVYTITVRNLGQETATGISVGGGVGDQFEILNMHCQDNGSFGQRTCQPSNLAAGKSMVATMTVFVCCLVRGENRHAFLSASVFSADDPNPDNDRVEKGIFIIGGRIK